MQPPDADAAACNDSFDVRLPPAIRTSTVRAVTLLYYYITTLVVERRVVV